MRLREERMNDMTEVHVYSPKNTNTIVWHGIIRHKDGLWIESAVFVACAFGQLVGWHGMA
jgi:hypothetical protein